MAQIGLLILMGVVVNNGIVLIDRVHQHREAGLDRESAILKACDDRLRPRRRCNSNSRTASAQ